MSDNLTDKQRLWIEEYLTCWNATEAVRRVGYRGSYDVLRQIGHDNLHNPQIRAIIEARIKEKAMSADEVLARIADIARGSMADFISVNGHTRLDFKRAQEAGRLHLIKTYSKGPKGTRLELLDPLKALELLGKAMGLFTERVDVTSGGEKIVVTLRGDD